MCIRDSARASGTVWAVCGVVDVVEEANVSVDGVGALVSPSVVVWTDVGDVVEAIGCVVAVVVVAASVDVVAASVDVVASSATTLASTAATTSAPATSVFG